MASYIKSQKKKRFFKPDNIRIENTTGYYGKDNTIDAATETNRTIFLMSGETREDKIDLLKSSGSDIVVLPSSDIPDNFHDKIDRIDIDISYALPGTMIC